MFEDTCTVGALVVWWLCRTVCVVTTTWRVPDICRVIHTQADPFTVTSRESTSLAFNILPKVFTHPARSLNSGVPNPSMATGA